MTVPLPIKEFLPKTPPLSTKGLIEVFLVHGFFFHRKIGDES